MSKKHSFGLVYGEIGLAYKLIGLGQSQNSLAHIQFSLVYPYNVKLIEKLIK